MKDFLDRVVARAGRQATSLRPRVAHRFGPPEHHLVPAGTEPEPGRDEDEDIATEGAGSSDEAAVPARATAALTEAGAATVAVAKPPGQERGAPALTPPAARAAAEPGRGPAGVDVSVPEEPAPQNGFVERLRARLRGPSAASADRTPGAPPLGDAVITSPAPGSLDGTPVLDAASAAQPGAAKGASRSAENEAAFWRFLYGPQAEAPASRRRSDDEAPATPFASQPAMTGVASRFEARAALRGAAATAGSDAPAAPMTITIGRVEVRALPPPAAPRPAPVPARRPPRLGLADYMRQTAPGARRR